MHSTRSRLTRSQLQGFTLVEVLVVIVVIGILAAFLLPIFARVREKGWQTRCSSNLRQIGMAYQMYLADYGRYPDPVLIWAPTKSAAYLKDRRVLFCPDDTDRRGTNGYGQKYEMALSYGYRMQVPPDLVSLSALSSLDPDIVLVTCDKHVKQREIPYRDGSDRTWTTQPAYPYHLVLRADGRVERVPLARVRSFYPHRVGAHHTLIYPGEPGYAEGKP